MSDPTTDDFAEDDDTETSATFAQLDELEKLETLIDYMEELGIHSLDEARARYTALEQTINSGQDDA